MKSIALSGADGKIRTLAEIEREAMINAVRECESLTEAARALGIGRSTLYRKFDEWGLNPMALPPEAGMAHMNPEKEICDLIAWLDSEATFELGVEPDSEHGKALRRREVAARSLARRAGIDLMAGA